MDPHLLLAYDFPPIGGGISRWMGELALRYPERSLIVSTGSIDGSAASDARFPVTVDRIATPAERLRTVPGLVRWSLRVDGLARSRGVTFAWCGNFRPAAYPARWLKGRRDVPYGVILHGGDLLILRTQAERSARKRRAAASLLGGAALLVTNSRFTRDLAIHTLDGLQIPFDPERIVIVPLGTDPNRFRPGVDPGLAREQFKLPEGRYLTTVARLTPHKGIDTALQVLARLAPRYPDLRYAVAGKGKDGERLGHLADSLGVADRVHWLGPVSDDLLPSLLCNASIYLGLSRQEGIDVEGFGISLVEASGCGVPVVGTKSGGIPDAVRDGETGMLLEAGDLDGIAAAVAKLLDDDALARRLGGGG
ncbi:MAG: glycosyltransferase family 4 protein [Actinomycetota bacterium]|nr:glycosyltransferase family 4 protein [Actinomycetota bacterium]